MMKEAVMESESWHVLVVGLPLDEKQYELGRGLTIRKLHRAPSVFDLAAAGAVGFREWATLEPLVSSATTEIVSSLSPATLPGYDALNRCWLASALIVLRGYARHVCPAVSGYSWDFIAGHQEGSSSAFQEQLREEGVSSAVYRPRHSLPPFKGGLLDYHLHLFVPPQTKNIPFNGSDAEWIRTNYEIFNAMVAKDERCRFALEAAIDWRYTKDPRIAMARLWSGIESLFGIKSELVYRISLLLSTMLISRGPGRVEVFKKCKRLYDIRSKAVHGESLEENQLVSGVFESYEILRLLLIDAAERGSVRSEDDHLRVLLC